MGIRTEKPLRVQLIFISILLMIAALFISRALLSVSMILFIFFTCIHKDFPLQVKVLFSDFFLIGIALLFLIPFLSWFWSDDKHLWFRFARIKFPLFILPLSFAGNWQLNKKQWQMIAVFFLIFLFGACCWSIFEYISNMQEIHAGYLRAKSIPTPLEDDHVRFSWLVAAGVICASLLIKQNAEKKIRIILVAVISFFIIYLHILSARTGLFSLYIYLLMLAAYLVYSYKKRKWVILLLSFLILMPVAAWFYFPTFQNRFRYILYDFSYIQKDSYLPGSNDGNRMLSLKAGWNILKKNPLGVGSGDVVPETYTWYHDHVPGMLKTDQFYPSSEWLMYGGIAGWFGFFLFTCIMLLPLFQKKIRERFFWLSLNTIAAFGFMFDIGLEVQFGVFIYAFIILWWWKWLRTKTNADINNELSIFNNHYLQERGGTDRSNDEEHSSVDR